MNGGCCGSTNNIQSNSTVIGRNTSHQSIFISKNFTRNTNEKLGGLNGSSSCGVPFNIVNRHSSIVSVNRTNCLTKRLKHTIFSTGSGKWLLWEGYLTNLELVRT